MDGYVNWSHALIRKAVIGILIIGGFVLIDGYFGRTLPTSFLPEEDYGYAMLHVQLPEAASLERTDHALRKIEDILLKRCELSHVDRRLQSTQSNLCQLSGVLLHEFSTVG